MSHQSKPSSASLGAPGMGGGPPANAGIRPAGTAGLTSASTPSPAGNCPPNTKPNCPNSDANCVNGSWRCGQSGNGGVNTPPNCPSGQHAVNLGGNWQCVPDQNPTSCGEGESWRYGPNGYGCYPTVPGDPAGGGGGGGGGGGAGAPGGGAPPGTPYPYGGSSGADDALTRAITRLAKLLAGQAEGIYNVGFPAYSQAVSYYSALLGRGGRGAASTATAPAAEGIAQNYAGAARGIGAGYLRGGAKDQALAELERSKAADIAHLTAGVQPGAAAALVSAGLGGAQAGMAGEAASGQLYGGLLANQTSQQQFGATLTENQRQFDADLAFKEKALAAAQASGGGGGGGGSSALAEAALAEQRRQFDASLAFQQQQQKSQKSMAMGQLIGGVVGTVATKSPAGGAAGAAAGGKLSRGSPGTGSGSTWSVPTTTPGSGTYFTG